MIIYIQFPLINSLPNEYRKRIEPYELYNKNNKRSSPIRTNGRYRYFNNKDDEHEMDEAYREIEEYEILDQADRKENELFEREYLRDWFNPEAELIDPSRVSQELKNVRFMRLIDK